MNKKLILLFKNRWKNVERIEHYELKKMSAEERLLKTSSVIQLGIGLGIMQDRVRDNEIQEVRSRWISLKKSIK